MDRKEAMRAACLSATLAVAWAGSASPARADGPDGTVGGNTVYIRTNFFHSLSGARFVGLNHLTWIGMVDMGAIDEGVSYRTLTVGTGSGSGVGGFGAYAFLGCCMPTILGGGLATGFSDPSVGLGRSFESVFPGFIESEVEQSIHTDTPPIEPFIDRLASMQATRMGINEPIPYTVLHFSDGAVLGTIEASFLPIPEPISGMVCLGAIGFGLISRRRTTSV